MGTVVHIRHFVISPYYSIVAKALDGQRYPLPLYEYVLVCDGERGSGPKGADDQCSVSFVDLGLNLSIHNTI